MANPLLLSAAALGAILALTGTPLETYETGGAFLSILLTPATVSLAGTLAGSLVSVGSIYALGRLFWLDWELLAALLPKSVTSPIALPLAESLGGLTAVTSVAVVFTGVTGAVALPSFLKLIGIREEVAQGVAIGTASHAVGTSRAITLSEMAGAMSSLSIGIAGFMTVGILTVFSFR
ncbi:MAG: LrgB family protein [Clostridiaceae bacterium]|nr:LrgB family protein [Clostridiaceae bacterium]